MPPTSNNENANQPRDTDGRFASWGQAVDGIDEATTALEQRILSGTTDEVEGAAQRLLAAVDRVPTLTQSEAERISTAIQRPKGDPISTGIWSALDLRCRNASRAPTTSETPSTRNA